MRPGGSAGSAGGFWHHVPQVSLLPLLVRLPASCGAAEVPVPLPVDFDACLCPAEIWHWGAAAVPKCSEIPPALSNPQTPAQEAAEHVLFPHVRRAQPSQSELSFLTLPLFVLAGFNHRTCDVLQKAQGWA